MPLRFALNHIAVPHHDVARLAALAYGLGMAEVEIRNDLPGTALADGTPAVEVRRAVSGLTLLSINALQRFEQWNATREAEAQALATYAQQAGAQALVLCPTNDTADQRDAATRAADLRAALAALAPILAAQGLTGLVEPLGFVECALRRKREALDAIDAVGAGDRFRLLHDTFHHYLSGEEEMFPERTGLVHISGVEDRAVAPSALRDQHRVLVGHADLIGNLPQIARLRRGGYAGTFSFEPFSPAVQAMPDIGAALADSMAYLTAGLAG